MGYTTEFQGEFELNRPLTFQQRAYLIKFSETRRVKRDPEKAKLMSDPLREEVGLPIGDEGQYFVGGVGFAGQDRDDSVLDGNTPPRPQPGLWCQWIPNETGTAIVWDEGEKFYEFIPWIAYLIDHFLRPWGLLLDGDMRWFGENPEDTGLIRIRDNRISIGPIVRKPI